MFNRNKSWKKYGKEQDIQPMKSATNYNRPPWLAFLVMVVVLLVVFNKTEAAERQYYINPEGSELWLEDVNYLGTIHPLVKFSIITSPLLEFTLIRD